MRVSAEIQHNIDLSATDIAALVMATILIVNVVWRISRSQLNNAGILWSNIAMALVMILSVSRVYGTIDPLLGGVSALNCLSHLLMIYAGWQISSTLAQCLKPFDGIEHRPALLRGWALGGAIIGAVGSYLFMSPTSSRGLDAYDHQAAFVTYWIATLLPLILGAIHLLPRMVKIAPLILKAKRLTAISLSMLWFGLAGILLSVLFYALSAMFQELWMLREIVVTLTSLLFAVGFLMATAALPQSTKRAIRHPRQESSQTQLQ